MACDLRRCVAADDPAFHTTFLFLARLAWLGDASPIRQLSFIPFMAFTSIIYAFAIGAPSRFSTFACFYLRVRTLSCQAVMALHAACIAFRVSGGFRFMPSPSPSYPAFSSLMIRPSPVAA